MRPTDLFYAVVCRFLQFEKYERKSCEFRHYLKLETIASAEVRLVPFDAETFKLFTTLFKLQTAVV